SVFRSICEEHGRIEPTIPTDDEEYGRVLVQLQQSNAALVQEARRRHEIEVQRNRLRESERAQRRRAEPAADQLAPPQKFTSALSESVTPAEIARTAVGELRILFGADLAALALGTEAGPLEVFVHGPGEVERPPSFAIPAGGASPIADVWRDEIPRWLGASELGGGGLGLDGWSANVAD